MKRYKRYNYTLKSILLLSMLFTCFSVFAQPGTAADAAKKTSRIEILGNEMGELLQSDSVTVQKLLWNVKLLHGSDTLYCDSAFFYTNKNSVEAFGDVVIRQADGTVAMADYMRYTGNNKVVYMKANSVMGEVQLDDGKENSLWSREIDYNLNTKIGKYRKRGYLQTATTTLSSNTGEYNMKTKDARFKGDVDVQDPEYRALSSDLGYNTDSRVARFFGPSIVTNDKSVLQTSNGVYDTKNRTSHFISRSSILNDGRYIEGDTIDYDRNSGFGYAIGNVIAIDTGMKMTLYCGHVEYNEIYKTMLAYDKPLMKKSDGKDSLFIKADTFYSAPDTASIILSAQDSLQKTAEELQGSVGADSLSAVSDTLNLLKDSTANQSIPTLPQTGDSIRNHSMDSLAGNTEMPPPDSFNLLLPVSPGEDSLDNSSEKIKETDTSDIAKQPPLPATGQKEEANLNAIKQKMDAMVYQKGNTETGNLSSDNPDTLAGNAIEHRRQIDSANATYNNTPQNADTSGPRFFRGYHNVLIYSDSLQGKCDSLRYSQVDSMLRMYKNPLLWPRNSQLKGDVINMLMDSSKLKEVHVPKNAIMITRSGPEKAGMYDQIQGNYIRGYLRNNQMDSLIAEPNASSIYFIKEDGGAYVGSSEAKSERIEVLFVNEEIDRIYYRVNVEQKTTPMKDVTPSSLHLSRFSWEEKQRPKTLEEFLGGTTLPHAPELLSMPDTGAEETERLLEADTSLNSQNPERINSVAPEDKNVEVPAKDTAK